MVSEQWIVVGGQIFRHTHSDNHIVKHATKRDAVDVPDMHAKADDAPRELIHHHQNPMRVQCDRFAAKKIDAPKAILHVANKRQPGGTVVTRAWSVMPSKDTSDDILVDLKTKRLGELLVNAMRGQPKRGLRDLSSTMA